MQAAVTQAWNKMALTERDTPAPGPGESLLKIAYAGVCGSDVHIFGGHHPTAVSPVIQGHELVGTIEAHGDADAALPIGTRVVVEPLITCGYCEACRTGTPHVCRSLKLLGIHTDGAFAEYMLAPTAKLIAVPDAVPDRVAALAEPFAVGFHVTRRAGLMHGERVAVLGAGPIGLIIAMVARQAGARVTLSEVKPSRIELARSLGFDVVEGSPDAAAALRDRTDDEGFDVVFEAAGVAPTIKLSTEIARIRGRIVQVGITADPPPISLLQVVFKELSLIGSRVYTGEDFRRTVPLLADLQASRPDDLKQIIADVRPLAAVEQSIADVASGACDGKILIDPTA